MNRTATIPLLTVAALALTACGGTDPDDLSQEEREDVARDVLAREMYNCDEDESTDECEERYEQDLSDDFEEAMGDSGAFGDGEYTSRMTGPVEAEFGEPVEIDLGPFANENDYAGTVALTGLEFRDDCPDYRGDAEDAPTPDNESFLYLTFEIETDEEAEDPIDMSGHEFVWGDYPYSVAGYEAFNCESDLGRQDPVEPGDSGFYTMVWDVPSTEVELEYREPTHVVTWEIDGDEGEIRRPADESGQMQDDAADQEPEASDEEAQEQSAEASPEPSPQQTADQPAEELPESDDHYDDHAEREGMTLDDTYDDEVGAGVDWEHCDELARQWEQAAEDINTADPGSTEEQEANDRMTSITAEEHAANCY